MEESGEKVHKGGIKRRYKVIGIVVLVLAGVFVGLNFMRDSQLEKRFNEIRADGFPVTLQELDESYSIPVGAENAADKYVAAFEKFNQPDLAADLPIFGSFEKTIPGKKFTPEAIKLMEDFIADNEETLKLLHEGAQIEHCRYPVDYTQGVNTDYIYLSESLNCTRLLCLNVILSSEGGRVGAVTKDIETIIALAKSFEKQPVQIYQLVRFSILRLAVDSIEYSVNRIDFNDEQLVLVTRFLADVETPDAMLRATAGERPAIIDYMQHCCDYPAISNLLGVSPAAMRLYSASGLNKSGLLEYLDFYDGKLSAIRLPEHQRVAAIKVLEAEMERLPWYHAVVKGGTIISYSHVFELDLRSIACLRVGRVGLAVERYGIAEGKLPESLDDIAPRFIDSIPLDPFDGKPIRYKRLDKGYVVYSIGKDCVDNGGKEEMIENYKEGNDVTFTVERAND